MKGLRIMLAALLAIGVWISVAQADLGTGKIASRPAAAVAWIEDGQERDGGPATPGPTDPNAPAR